MTFKDCINTMDSLKKSIDDSKGYVDTKLDDYPTINDMNTAIETAIADIPTGSGWDPLTIDNIRDYLRDMNGITVATNDMLITIPLYKTVDNVESKIGVCQAFIKAGEQFRIPLFGSNVTFDSSPFSMEYIDCFVWYGLGNFIVACTVYIISQNSSTKDIEITEQSLNLTMKDDLSGFVNPVQPR